MEASLEQAVMAMELSIEDDQLTPVSCHLLEADRVARFQALYPDLSEQNAVAVICNNSAGECVETVVNGETMTHCLFEDPIMCEEHSICSLVEAQFEPDGRWTVSRADVEQLNQEKRTQFKRYSDMISRDQPDCLKTLRSLLQSRPITCLYSGGGNPPHIPSHQGFGLRMPEDEVEQWQTVDDKGRLQDIPRPAHALRVWDAATQSYLSIDPTMEGAPSTPEEVDVWFVQLIQKLKASEYLGPELIDNLVTSEKYEYDYELERPCNFSGSFSNKWTDLIVATKIDGQ